MDFIRGDRKYTGWLPIITILLDTGVRIGKALGILWSDIDFEKRILTISKTMNEDLMEMESAENASSQPKQLRKTGISLLSVKS